MKNETEKSEFYLSPEDAAEVEKLHRETTALPHSEPIDLTPPDEAGEFR